VITSGFQRKLTAVGPLPRPKSGLHAACGCPSGALRLPIEPAYSQQVVSGCSDQGTLLDLPAAGMPGSPHAANFLLPADRLLDALPNLLCPAIAFRPLTSARAPVRGPLRSDRECGLALLGSAERFHPPPPARAGIARRRSRCRTANVEGVTRCLLRIRRIMRSASCRSARPFASLVDRPMIKPLRFCMRMCIPCASRLAWPFALRASRASGSVIDRCVTLLRRSPRKLTVGLPGSSSSDPSLTRVSPLAIGRRLL
jgi:hypothetical protein